jgi:hypothetical protein
MIDRVFSCLKNKRLDMNDEKRTQEQVADYLRTADICFIKEHPLDKGSIVDFMLEDGVAIEVKIKGSRMSVYRQIERYCKFDDVKSIILLCTYPFAMPPEINGKSVYVLNLSSAWL